MQLSKDVINLLVSAPSFCIKNFIWIFHDLCIRKSFTWELYALYLKCDMSLYYCTNQNWIWRRKVAKILSDVKLVTTWCDKTANDYSSFGVISFNQKNRFILQLKKYKMDFNLPINEQMTYVFQAGNNSIDHNEVVLN